MGEGVVGGVVGGLIGELGELALVVHGEEGLDDVGVEVGSGAGFDLGDGPGGGPGFFIDAVTGEGIEDIDDVHDACGEGDVGGGVLVGVASAVPAFVMGSGDGACGLEEGGVCEDGLAGGGVLLHALAFVGGEGSWFFEDVVGDGDFADVVQDGVSAEGFGVEGGEAEVECQVVGVKLDASDVGPGVLIAGFGGDGEHGDGGAVGGVELVGAASDPAFEFGVVVLQLHG